MTPLQTATMIKVCLDLIAHHAGHAEHQVSTIRGLSMPEGRDYLTLQETLRRLYEACDVLRLNLQDERSDLAPPTREEMISAVMSAMHFRERTTQYGDVILTGTLAMESSVQFRPDPRDLHRKDRMKRELADRAVDSLSPDRLEAMVKWHRERLAAAVMEADAAIASHIQSEEQNP